MGSANFIALLTIVGGVRDALLVWLRGRWKTVCARVAWPAWSSGPSTSPLGEWLRLAQCRAGVRDEGIPGRTRCHIWPCWNRTFASSVCLRGVLCRIRGFLGATWLCSSLAEDSRFGRCGYFGV